MNYGRMLAAGVALAALGAISATAAGAQNYPVKTVTLITHSSPGAGGEGGKPISGLLQDGANAYKGGAAKAGKELPVQSGSDRVLKAMRRSYRSERFLGIIDRVRQQIPNAAITTDIIVGFPGETEEDFEETLRVVRESRFSSAFTFQYSIRPGTPAATMDDQVPKEVVQERYERLVALQEEISWAGNREQEGRELEVLVATGEGRKDRETARLSGRAPDNRLVHFALPEDLPEAERPRPGDMVTVGVTYGAPHHLVADSAITGGVFAVRRTAGGDAWAALQEQGAEQLLAVMNQTLEGIRQNTGQGAQEISAAAEDMRKAAEGLPDQRRPSMGSMPRASSSFRATST